MNLFSRVSVFIFSMFACSVLWAQEAVNVADKTSTPTGSPISTSGMIIQVLTALFMVTISIFVLAWLMKRLGGQSLLQQRGMKMLATMPVGAREKIALVEVEGKRLLIGVASGNVNCLHVFEDEIETASNINAEQSAAQNADDTSSSNSATTTATPFLKTEKWDFASAFKQLIKDGERKE